MPAMATPAVQSLSLEWSETLANLPRSRLIDLLRPHLCNETCPCCGRHCAIFEKPYGTEGPCVTAEGHLFGLDSWVPR